MKAHDGGNAVRCRVRLFLALLGLLTALGPAKADFVSYSFNGAAPPGILISGSFAYDTASQPSAPFGGPDVVYPNVGGSLSITYQGQTYTSHSISANLEANKLVLVSNPSSALGSMIIDLEWSGPGLSSLTSLPKQLDPNRLQPFSKFTIGGGPSQPILAGGYVTELVAPKLAALPEPGSLTLASVAVVGILARLRRRRSRAV